jgi:glycosyltransferase involved in cell wall biosynthesis
MPMHIGFDVSQTGAGKAGCGYYAHAMIEALLEIAPRHRYSLYPGFGDFYYDPRMPLWNPYSGRDVRYGPRHFSRAAAAAFWNSPGVEAALGHPDVIHANNFWCPAQLGRSRLVYTCYDLGFMVDPSWTIEANRVGCFDGMFRSAVCADWVVAISEATRAHYLRVFPHYPEERVRVIHPCSRFADAAAEGKRPAALREVAAQAFWLSVGTIEPRKNQAGLARAYARYLAMGGPPMPLVLAGGNGWLMEGFRQQLHDLGIAGHVVMTGYVSNEELAWLYRNCFANLYASFFEGFGLPVLEGMQFGAATLVSNATALPEVAGEAAILLVPADVEGWAAAMLRLARAPGERQRLRAAARLRATHFDRGASAAALLGLYAEAVASPRLAVTGGE